MNSGDANGFGGAMTFLDVWAGTAPTVDGLAYDWGTQTFTATGHPSPATATHTYALTGYQTAITPDATTAPVWSATTAMTGTAISTTLALTTGQFVWVRVQQDNTVWSAPVSLQPAAPPPPPPPPVAAPTVAINGYTAGTLTATGTVDSTLAMAGYQTAVLTGQTPPVDTDWSATTTSTDTAITAALTANAGQTLWVRIQDSANTWSAPASLYLPLPPTVTGPAFVAIDAATGTLTATGAADIGLTLQAYAVAVTADSTQPADAAFTTQVGAPAAISVVVTASTGQFVWVRVQDSNGVWSTPVSVQVP
jgi:hypothetical protein